MLGLLAVKPLRWLDREVFAVCVSGGLILQACSHDKHEKRDRYVFHSCLRILGNGYSHIGTLKRDKPPKTAGQRVPNFPRHPHPTRLAVQVGHSVAVRSDVKEEAAGRGTVAQYSSAVARLHRKATI